MRYGSVCSDNEGPSNSVRPTADPTRSARNLSPIEAIRTAGKLLVVGDIMTDIIAKPERPLNVGSDTPARIESHLGGSAANQATWLAQFNTKVTLVAKVGASDAERHRSSLLIAGVEPCLAVDPTGRTGSLVSLIDPDGQRTFLTDRGANDSLDVADLPDELLSGASVLHVSAYPLFAARSRAAVLDLMSRARRRGIVVTIDPASAGFLQDLEDGDFFRWTAGAAICFPNADEAIALTHTTDPKEQRLRLARHYPLVVIKRGALGAEVSGEGGVVLAERRAPAVRVVDTTGAGDAFLARFLSGLVDGESLDQATTAAVNAGAHATTFFGGRASSSTMPKLGYRSPTTVR